MLIEVSSLLLQSCSMVSVDTSLGASIIEDITFSSSSRRSALIASIKPATLNRRIGLFLLLFYGLGNILGAGIYVLIGKVAGEAGYGTAIAFGIASAAAGFTVFSYAELSARYPVSAGEAVYLYEGFQLKSLSIIVGILLALSGIASTATISHGFAGYFQLFWVLPEWLLISTLIITLGLISLWGIGESVKLAAVLTVIEIVGLLLIVWVGIEHIDGRQLESVVKPAVASGHGITFPGLMLGAFLAFYAFIGFEDMVNIAEEVERPQRNLPLAAILALLVASVLYGITSWVATAVVSPAELAQSDAPLALVYERATGNAPVTITIISSFAVINGALIQLIMGSRILYGMARRSWMPAVFGEINRRTRTPVLATLVVIALSLVFALALPLIQLAELTSFMVLTVFVLVNAALIRIKATIPAPEGVKLFPLWVPYCGLFVSLGFIASKTILML